MHRMTALSTMKFKCDGQNPPTMTHISCNFKIISNDQLKSGTAQHFTSAILKHLIQTIQPNQRKLTHTNKTLQGEREREQRRQSQLNVVFSDRRSKQKVKLNSLSLVIQLRYSLHVSLVFTR